MVREAVKEENAEILVVAAKTEADIAELETYEDRQMFLQEAGLEESGVNRLIKAAYKLLDLETFITAGEMEVKAWTYRKGWKAPNVPESSIPTLKRLYPCRSHQIRRLYSIWFGSGRQGSRKDGH